MVYGIGVIVYRTKHQIVVFMLYLSYIWSRCHGAAARGHEAPHHSQGVGEGAVSVWGVYWPVYLAVDEVLLFAPAVTSKASRCLAGSLTQEFFICGVHLCRLLLNAGGGARYLSRWLGGSGKD